MKLQVFLDKHNACKEGADWATSTGCETIEELWLRDDMRGDWRMWIARRTLPTRTLQLFACRAVRTIWHLLKDERSKNAVIIAEAYLAGTATIKELKLARADASDAAYAAAAADAAYAAAASDAAAYASDAAYASAAAADAAADAAYAAAYASDAAYASAAAYAAAAARRSKWEELSVFLLELSPTIAVHEEVAK